MSDIFVARQPIFDDQLSAIGYELLFRAGEDDDTARFEDGDMATRNVVSAFAEIGIENLVGGRTAFINVSPDFLLADNTLPLPPDRVVVELLEGTTGTPELIETVHALRSKEYRVALDDFVPRPELEPLLSLADYVKVDALQHEPAALEEIVTMLAPHTARLVAEKVETHEMLEVCRELGFHHFQGHFLEQPKTIKTKVMPVNNAVRLQLLAKLADPEADFKELEVSISRDVGLSYKLLRYINSAYFGLRRRIDSIREATVMLGMMNIKKWATVMVLAGEDKPPELIVTALIRARMAELVAGEAGVRETDAYYTAGLFSVVDALMDMPMKNVLSALPFSDDMSDALLYKRGPMGDVLKAVVAHERGDRAWLNGAPTDLTVPYLKAVVLADEVGQALAA
jgi:c-di-GMP phosphodiesterase